ncbi:hypothetical protein HYS49_01085 [Candidatus Woesearchaeota archaeon]|nr:hypothetical protein [Candidatus Woesearchaeota archaeon]
MKQLLALSVKRKRTYVSAKALEKGRRFSIESYMNREAGIHPAGRVAPAWVIDKKDWPYRRDYSGFWIKKKRQSKSMENPLKPYILIREAEPYRENAIFVHEALGHGGFEEYISPEKSTSLSQLSEAFARTLEMMLIEDRQSYSSPSDSIYTVGTKELTQAASTISLHIGKRGIVQLFYVLTPQRVPPERAVSFCKELAWDASLLHAFGVLAARYGGEIIGRLVQRPRLDVLRAAITIKDEMVRSSSDATERKLMQDYLSKEFSLGDAFAQFYLREAKPSSLEELIMKKARLSRSPVYVIDRASALKWVGAHRGGAFPCYDQGMNVLESLGKTLSSFTDLDGEKRAPPRLHNYCVRRQEEQRKSRGE